MGYPMTFQRVVNRNGLGDGDYSQVPARHVVGINVSLTEIPDPAAWQLAPEEERDHVSVRVASEIAEDRVKRLVSYEQTFKALAGDLRRLEQDAVDEGAICRHIADRTGIDADIVAVVLKEFISW